LSWSLAATVFGIGRAPVAPGTLASLVALPIAWAVMMLGGSLALLILGGAVAVFGIWAGEAYAVERGDPDPADCVIDEVAGQFLACALAPMTVLGFALAFVLFRLFDVSKLWPVSAAERLPGGFGIVLDDVVAGLIAGGIVAIFYSTGII
jgi:phosphatidylglycerophosphatase A